MCSVNCNFSVSFCRCHSHSIDFFHYNNALGFIHTCDLSGVNYCVNFSFHVIVGTQPIIELFSSCKSWINSKCECVHLVQYNPLFSDWFSPNKSQVWMDPKAQETKNWSTMGPTKEALLPYPVQCVWDTLRKCEGEKETKRPVCLDDSLTLVIYWTWTIWWIK